MKWMRIGFVAALAVLLAGCGGSAPTSIDETHPAAERLVIRDFIGRLTIETVEPGADIEVEAELRRGQGGLLPIEIRGESLEITWLG